MTQIGISKDISQPIDFKNAMQLYGDNKNLFCTMLDHLELSGSHEHIKDLAEAVASKDYETIMKKAQASKGNAVWVGALRLHYAC